MTKSAGNGKLHFLCSEKCKNYPFAQLEVIANRTCDINSAITIEQNEKVQHSSSVILNSTILK